MKWLAKKQAKLVILCLALTVILLVTFSVQSYNLSILDYGEVRGVFIHSVNTSGINAETVCATLEPYGVNLIVLEALGSNYARYPSAVLPSSDYNILPEFVNAAHNHGMELYISMNVVASQNVVGIVGSDGMCTRYNNGNPTVGASANPLNQAYRNLVKSAVEELVTNYDIDGFMFDYIRFEWGDEPYNDNAKTAFIADTGLSDVNWGPDTHVSSGRYYTQFWQWRCTVINDLVQDMHQWILVVDSNMEFSAAVWNYAFNANYWKIWKAQDPVAWATSGWLDWVSPMIYTDSVSSVVSGTQTFRADFEPLGVPVVPFIDSCVDAPSTPQNLADRINALRDIDAKGWIIWRYGGAGDVSGSPDLTDTFDLLNMPSQTPNPSSAPQPSTSPSVTATPNPNGSPSPSSEPNQQTNEAPWYQPIIDLLRWLFHWE